VQFFDETEDISRIMSAPHIEANPMFKQDHSDTLQPMEYGTAFEPIDPNMTQTYGSASTQSSFSTQTPSFVARTSPSVTSILSLERLALGDSPSAGFSSASQGSGTPPGFRDFDTAVANMTGGMMPIETMLDVTAMGQPAFVPNMVTEQTAQLMRHYIDNLASWMDLSDSRNHFSTVVPKRALTSVSPSIQPNVDCSPY
jgi:hypothetical protein